MSNDTMKCSRFLYFCKIRWYRRSYLQGTIANHIKTLTKIFKSPVFWFLWKKYKAEFSGTRSKLRMVLRSKDAKGSLNVLQSSLENRTSRDGLQFSNIIKFPGLCTKIKKIHNFTLFQFCFIFLIDKYRVSKNNFSNFRSWTLILHLFFNIFSSSWNNPLFENYQLLTKNVTKMKVNLKNI